MPPPSAPLKQNGVLGLGHEKEQQIWRPSRVPGLEDVRQLAAGWKHNAAVTDGGRLYTWGWGGSQGKLWVGFGGPTLRGCLGRCRAWRAALLHSLPRRKGPALHLTAAALCSLTPLIPHPGRHRVLV